ncbi:response regulator [Thioflexithrix psekupsensis]|uniref:Response regulatory domain-containing protein n=1 Tax=Thioflexithrix psekupsensis TaxID=1570016 RepID=A0A251X3I5_9GAMM|nr:response regulator [Thioflexithrix psekupsensis]OUD11738.1 hypothetical protein TPSD3_16955 [Thioflexithrix psekupsensis]
MTSEKITILIIDDEIVSRATLEALLECPEYALVLAETGSQGLEKATTLTPDLILLDVMMPGMNGFEVCRRLRADPNPKLAKLPVIVITAWNDATARARCLEIGANEVICKPFERDDLHRRVRHLLRLDGLGEPI